MQYQTLDQLRQRCADELPGFDAVRDDALLRAWVWDALRLIDTERLGELTEGEVTVRNGTGQLPDDFLGIRSIIAGGTMTGRSPYHVIPGSGILRGKPDGCLRISYYALPLDDEGYPYILDAAEMAVLAYVEWKFTALEQKKMQLATAYGFRVDTMANRENERRALSMISAVRGDLNMLSQAEAESLRYFRQQLMTYRNG